MEPNPAVYYHVWGIDNIAYGPVELPPLVGWIRDGRVFPESWIFTEKKGEWARAAEIQELKLAFRPKNEPAPASAPPGIKPGSLRRIKIFADMDERQLASFLQYMQVVKLMPNAVACRKGEHGDAMFMVLEGEVRARVMIDGKESTLKVLDVGECFGELAVIDESPRSADVVANKDSVLLKISANALKKLFQEAPALSAPFLMGLCKTLTGRIRYISKRYEDSIHFARTAQGE